jgi:lambda family phage tail tape measure protein
MTDQVTTLGLAVDSSGVVSAKTALDAMKQSGDAAAASTSRVGDAARAASTASKGVNELAAAATTANKSIGAAGVSTQGVAAAAAATAKGTRELADGFRISGQQAQILAVQVKDFFESIISGQNPLRAFAQQAGTSISVLGGFRNALTFVGSALTGLVGAALAVAASVGVLAVAFFQGASESANFAKQITLTGAAAGVTEGQYRKLAEAISTSTQTSIGSAKETLAALIATGRFGGDALTQVATAAQLLGKVTGQTTEEIVKSFTRMADSTDRWADETNKSYHFLSAEQLKYVRALVDQGRTQEAIVITAQALVDRLDKTQSKLGLLERAWIAAGKAASGAWDAMKGIGRADTVEDQIGAATAKLESLQARLKLFAPGAVANARPGGEVEDLQRQISAQQQIVSGLQQTKTAEDQAATAGARRAQQQQALNDFYKLGESSLTRQQQQVKALADANALADKADLAKDDPLRLKTLANITQQFTGDLGQVRLQDAIAKIQRSLQTEVEAFRNADSLLDSQRELGLVQLGDYYAQKRAFIDADTNRQIRALTEENVILAKRTGNAREDLANQRTIADNREKIARLTAEADTKVRLSANAQTKEQQALAQARREAQRAAEDGLAFQNRDQSRQLGQFGLGDQERARLAARARIQDEFEAQRQQVLRGRQDAESNGTFGPDQQKKYDADLARIRDFQSQSLTSFDTYYSALLEKQASFANGASDALNDYLATINNVSAASKSLFTDSFKSAEDALVDFVKTGKLNLNSLVETIISGLARIAIQQAIIKPLLGALGGGASSGLVDSIFAGFFADGGDIPSGKVGIAGESGPELIRGPASVMPLTGRNASWGGDGFAYHDNRTLIFNPGVNRNEVRAAMTQAENGAIARISEAQRRGRTRAPA